MKSKITEMLLSDSEEDVVFGWNLLFSEALALSEQEILSILQDILDANNPPGSLYHYKWLINRNTTGNSTYNRTMYRYFPKNYVQSSQFDIPYRINVSKLISGNELVRGFDGYIGI